MPSNNTTTFPLTLFFEVQFFDPRGEGEGDPAAKLLPCLLPVSNDSTNVERFDKNAAER